MKKWQAGRVVEVISGVSMILAPVTTMIAFYIHPQFWTIRREFSAVDQYGYIQDLGWQIGHTLVYITIPFVILMWLHLARMLSAWRPGLALVGGLLSLVGLVFMAGQFGMSLGQGQIGLTLPQEQAVSAIQVLQDRPGLIQVTLWGQVGALLGPLVLSIGLALTPEFAPPWRAISAVAGNLIIAAALDIDFIMFWGECLILIGLWPIAFGLLEGKWSESLPGPEPAL